MYESQYQCPDCGCSQAYRSRPRNLLERYFVPILLLRPVRCINCYRRSLISIFIHLPDRTQKEPRRAAA
jgi:hypothetical protein